MTLPTPSSPSSSQSSAPDREEPDCPAIVPPSMPVAREGDQQHDDKQWTDIVVASLSGRSPKAREALLKALLNDEPARSTGSSSSIIEDLEIGGPEVSEHAAAAHEQTQACSDASNNITSALDHGDGSGNIETSHRTVPPILPLRSNASAKALGKDRLNGQCTTARSMPSNPRPNPVGCTIAEVLPVPFPLPESNPMPPETRTHLSAKRESHRSTRQFPATRSSRWSNGVRRHLN